MTDCDCDCACNWGCDWGSACDDEDLELVALLVLAVAGAASTRNVVQPESMWLLISEDLTVWLHIGHSTIVARNERFGELYEQERRRPFVCKRVFKKLGF